VGANKKSQAFNSVITNLNFALEGMMRDLRTASKYDCGATGFPYDCVSSPGSRITASSSQYKTQVTYELSNGSIYKTLGIGGFPALLTSPDVTIDKLDFYVTGTALPGAGDYEQPKIILVLSGRYKGYGSEGRFNMQTTVSQRKLDLN
jgi:hypothetical protein